MQAGGSSPRCPNRALQLPCSPRRPLPILRTILPAPGSSHADCAPVSTQNFHSTIPWQIRRNSSYQGPRRQRLPSAPQQCSRKEECNFPEFSSRPWSQAAGHDHIFDRYRHARQRRKRFAFGCPRVNLCGPRQRGFFCKREVCPNLRIVALDFREVCLRQRDGCRSALADGRAGGFDRKGRQIDSRELRSSIFQ